MSAPETINDLMLAAIPATLVDVLWPQVEPIINRAVLRSNGDVTLDSLRADLKRGETLMVTVSRGTSIVAANILRVNTLESGKRILWIPIVAGDELEQWMERFLAIAHVIAAEYECEELRGIAVRGGWARKLKSEGWAPVHTVLACKVRT